MDINRRLIGASAVLSPERKVIDVDVSGLIRRLLLFDKYVLVSVRLQEFPLLLTRLGFEGLRDLLSAKLIEIRCECLQLSQTAQSGLLGDPVLPPFSYKFHWIDAHDRTKYVRDCLQDLHNVPGLQRKQISKLKVGIAGAIRRLPEDFRSQLFPVFGNEMIHNQDLVKTAVKLVIQRQLSLENAQFSMAIQQVTSDTFKVKTDVGRRLGISELEAHKIVEAGMMGVAGLTQSIGEMKVYSAISGFRDAELPLFRLKMDFLADTASSGKREANFQRVIDIAGLPNFPTQEGSINIEKLLEARNSSEAREFRDWLGGIGEASDREIEERVAGLRVKAGLKTSSEAGKAIRFLVTTGLGLMPQTSALGVGVGVFDQFLLDKLLPRSGIAAFVNELYPSIFDARC